MGKSKSRREGGKEKDVGCVPTLKTAQPSPAQASHMRGGLVGALSRMWLRVGLLRVLLLSTSTRLIPEISQCSRQGRRDGQAGFPLGTAQLLLVDLTEWPGRCVGADVAEYPYASASPASRNNCVPSLIWRRRSPITISPVAAIILVAVDWG